MSGRSGNRNQGTGGTSTESRLVRLEEGLQTIVEAVRTESANTDRRIAEQGERIEHVVEDLSKQIAKASSSGRVQWGVLSGWASVLLAIGAAFYTSAKSEFDRHRSVTEEAFRSSAEGLQARARWIGGIDRGLADIVRRIDRSDAALLRQLNTLEAQDLREADRVQALEGRMREDLGQLRALLQASPGG